MTIDNPFATTTASNSTEKPNNPTASDVSSMEHQSSESTIEVIQAPMPLKRNLNSAFKRHAEPLDHENKHPNLHENTEYESVKSVVTSAAVMEMSVAEKKKRMEQNWQKAVQKRPPMHKKCSYIFYSTIIASTYRRN